MASAEINSLHVYLNTLSREVAAEWKLRNSAWLDKTQDAVTLFGYEAGRLVCEPLSLRGEAAQALSGGTDVAALLEGFSSGDLLLADPAWTLYPNWRKVVDKARSLAEIDTATGRAVTSKITAGHTEHADETPAAIVGNVVEWFFSPFMHGLPCRALPSEFLWVKRSTAQRLLLSMAQSADLASAIAALYAFADLTKPKGLNLYLPDFVAAK